MHRTAASERATRAQPAVVSAGVMWLRRQFHIALHCTIDQ